MKELNFVSTRIETTLFKGYKTTKQPDSTCRCYSDALKRQYVSYHHYPLLTQQMIFEEAGLQCTRIRDFIVLIIENVAFFLIVLWHFLFHFIT